MRRRILHWPTRANGGGRDRLGDQGALDLIRSDRTGHELRLAQLLPVLDEEFAPTRSPEEIRACADAILARFETASVRQHVLTLAHRQTRECLTAETCDAVAT